MDGYTLRVLVCGGRGYNQAHQLATVLEAHFQPGWVLIQGGAKGADALAKSWAEHSGYEVVEYPADWKKYGPRAGPIRNQKMLRYGKPDLVIAFPGGRGTAHMVHIAKQAGVEVIQIGNL